MTGFLFVDKPAGWTSHDVVAWVRRRVGGAKVGHAGTLDPMATGLLVLGVGRATRLLRFAQATDKEYLARAVFGVATDSLDSDGAILERAPMAVTEGDVARVMERFVGIVHQVPPMVSARKVGGRRLYDIARRGGEVEREARPVTIHELELVDFAPSEYPEVEFRTVCSSGTYIRTLGDDIAASLGGRAHLIALRRLRSGSIGIDRAVTMDDVESSDDVASLLVSPQEALGHLPSVAVGDELATAVRHGAVVPATAVPAEPNGPFLVVGASGLIAVYRSDGRTARPEVVVG